MADIASIERTFVLGTDGLTYFEVITTVYENEEETVVKKLIGPAGRLAEHYADDFVQKARTIATNAFPAGRARRDINELNDNNADIVAITGVSPKAVIQDRFEDELLEPGWTIDAGAELPLVFTINAQGVLRYAINGGATQIAEIWGAIIRLNNYPSQGTITEFFALENYRRFFSLPNAGVIIKRP